MNYLLIEGRVSNISNKDRKSPRLLGVSIYRLELLAPVVQCLILAPFTRICEGLKVPELEI